MQLLLTTLKFILLVLTTGAVLLYLVQDRLLFYPRPLSPATRQKFANEQITFTREGITLQGWLVRSSRQAQTKPFIIYYGGNAEEVSANIAEIANYPAQAVLFMNYRGFGDSTGKPAGKELCADALYIFDRLLEQERLQAQNIVLLGRSLGSAVAVHVASRRPVKAVILVTAFDSLPQVARHYFPFLPLRLLIKYPFDSAALAKNIAVPMLNIMAENDEVIPRRHAENLARNWLGPVDSVTVEQASHNNISAFSTYWRTLDEFISKLKPSAASL